MKKVLLILLVVVIGGGAAALLAISGKEAETSEEPQELRQVITRSIELQDIGRTVEGQVYIQSAQMLAIHSQVQGEVIYALEDLKEAVSFTEGDLLLQVDSRSIDSQVQLAQTELLKGLSALLSALSSSDPLNISSRWTQFRAAVISNRELPALPAALSDRETLIISQYGIMNAYYQLRDLKRNQADHWIYAPFNGVVRSGFHPVGSMLYPSQEVATLINPQLLECSLSVTLEESAYLESSQQISVKIYPSEHRDFFLEGEILRFSDFLDSQTQTRNIYIGFENPQRLGGFLPGGYGHVELEGDPQSQALEIPREWLNSDSTLNFLIDGKLSKVPVTLEGYRGDTALVTGSQLQDGMEIIVTRLQVPIQGMELEAIQGDFE